MINGLSKRLHMSRINSELSRKQVSEIVGISESTLGLYESGNRQPSLSVLIKLANTYKVTTDYLLGCESVNTDSISLIGLNQNQIKAINLTIKCFRENTN